MDSKDKFCPTGLEVKQFFHIRLPLHYHVMARDPEIRRFPWRRTPVYRRTGKQDLNVGIEGPGNQAPFSDLSEVEPALLHEFHDGDGYPALVRDGKPDNFRKREGAGFRVSVTILPV